MVKAKEKETNLAKFSQESINAVALLPQFCGHAIPSIQTWVNSASRPDYG